MGVYEPLARHLSELSSDVWNAEFSEIESILSRKLPDSAYDYRPWWGNQKKGNHSQAKAWREAGWETRDVDLEHQTVRFERVRPVTRSAVRTGERSKVEELFQKAHRLTGIENRDVLIEAALTALVRREAAKQLSAMGGTMPDFAVPPRERPSW